MINEIRHIRAFLAVARHSNFTKAAQDLHVSQSALTVQIQQLEEAIGIRLFDRTNRRVVLTGAGRSLIGPLQRILIDTENIVSQTRDISNLRRGTMSLAVLPSVAAGILSEVLRQFTAGYPGIVVHIHDVVADKVVELVKKEEVDFGIGTTRHSDRELIAVELFRNRLFAFLPLKHPLSSRASLSLNQLAKYPLVLTGKDSGVRAIVEDALQRKSLHGKYAYEVNYMPTLLSLVRAGFGVGILPEHADAMGAFPDLVRIPIGKPQLTRQIQIITRKGRNPSPSVQKMLEILRKVAGKASA
jgi:LysR family transcriptional regulator, carnitine catabolism transcriptional activator